MKQTYGDATSRALIGNTMPNIRASGCSPDEDDPSCRPNFLFEKPKRRILTIELGETKCLWSMTTGPGVRLWRLHPEGGVTMCPKPKLVAAGDSTYDAEHLSVILGDIRLPDGSRLDLLER
jgi:hypothetical protein